MSNLPLISMLLVTLPMGAALIWLTPDPSKARWIALFAAIADLCIALAVLANFDSSYSGFQFIEHASWIPTLNVNYHVGVDGISVLLLPLTVVLVIGVILSSWTSTQSMPRLYYSLLLLLESATLGIFCSLDTILFFLFWELTLIPIFFIISLWGVGPDRRYAAVKYTLFMMAGGIALLFAFILLAYDYSQTHGVLTFDYPTLIDNPVSIELQVTIFFLLLVGFAPKIPLFPLHTWLPVIAMEGPASMSAIMTGLKLGAFGLIRSLVPLTPDASVDFHWLLAALGVIGVVYGALLALAQTNLRRMLAYSSMSHVGLVVLGIASFNLQGIQGAVFQLINFVIVSGGLFLLVGFLHHRTGSTDIASLGGVVNTMPLLTAFFFLLGLASMGVPGTNGFPAEFLILISALEVHTGAGIAVLATIVLGAAYFLGIYRRAFLGPVTSSVVMESMDLRQRELLVAVIFAMLVLLLGLFPGMVLDIINTSTTSWVEHIKAH